MRVDELTFPAMGSTAHVVVVGPEDGALVDARRQIGELERLWTRFDPASELSVLNANAGTAVRVSAETIDVVERAVQAWESTDGCYDPTVHDALVDAGYDRPFASLSPVGVGAATGRRAPGCGDIRIDRRGRSIRFPAGVHVDLGGIGKGCAADLVVERLRDAGAAGALVNIGGDLRVSGAAPGGGDWPIGVEDPAVPGRIERVVGIRDAGVATSSTLRRTWERNGRRRHHLIDPRTGDPCVSSLRSATVFAADATRAEILATAVMIAGAEPGAELLRRHGATGVLSGSEVSEVAG